jgi:hypothetical protein
MSNPAVRSYKFVTKLVRKELTYAAGYLAADFVNTLVPIEAEFSSDEPTWRDDSAEINGYAGATDADIEAWAGGRGFKCYASPEIAQFFYALQFGNVTTTGSADPYTHVNKWSNICTLNPPSFAFLEAPSCAGETANYKMRKGVCVEQVELDINGRSSVILTAQFKHDGSRTDMASVTLPSTPFIPSEHILGSMVTCKFGTLGTENLNSVFRSAKVTTKSNLTVPPSIAAGLYITEMQFGDKSPVVDMDLTIKGDANHVLYTAFLAKTVLILDLTIDCGTTPSRTLRYQAAQVLIQECKEVPSSSETQLQMKLRFLFNATDAGAMRITTTTGVSAYLATS